MYDTRQVYYSREGHFEILPKPPVYVDGVDINAHANFNILSIQSRVGLKISGPDFFGMKTAGRIEGAFFGNTDQSIGEFRLRLAYVTLSNEKIEILIGQFWHPMFVTSVFPAVYSFNTGVPFQPFSRNPQLRITTKGKIKFIAAAFTERDFQTRGASVSQSGIPTINAQLQFGDANKTIGGFGYNLKTTRPNIWDLDPANLPDRMVSNAGFAYIKTKLGKTGWWKMQGTYGENMSDLLQVSGFGELNNEYVNNRTFSIWTEFMGDFSESFEWGIFGGFTQNFGYGQEIVYVNGFLGGINENAFRISPRVGWKSGKLKIGIETEYTGAQYGTIDSSGEISSTGVVPVDNLRILATAIYNF
jgi:hypothetical protein